jgi:iron(III) transport system substrate-binding protein
MKQHFSRLCSLCLTIGALLSPAAHALTVYTAGPANLINALGEGFKKETGITVDVFQADTGKVMARLEAEAANPRADVVISASWESALDLDKRGWLLHWQSANAASVPAVYKGPAYVAQGLSALAIVWNPKSGTPRPTDWSDLAKPEFKDKVNMPDPASSGTALELLSGLQAAQGDKAWKLFEALKANGMAVGGANAAALNPVLQGAKAAVFGAVDYVTLGAVAKGEAVEVIFPSSGTIVAARPMMILKSSKAQDDAKKFIDYVLSPQGQALVAEVFLMPARSDAAAKRKPASEIKVLPAEGEGAQAARKALLERFSALFGRK